MTAYKRVTIKVSGESLGLLDPQMMTDVARVIASIHVMGIGQSIVVGGGNLIRGGQAAEYGIDQTTADEAGMIATGLNVRILDGILAGIGIPAQIYSRGPATGIGLPYNRDQVRTDLDLGHVVLLAGGMGISGISTDVPAVHAAIETSADAVIMAKHDIDGVYDDDPRLNPAANFLPQLTASHALDQRLAVMDAAALALAREHGVRIHVIRADEPANIRYVVEGKEIGSVIIPL